MTEERRLTCIRCPMGCQLTVTVIDGEVTDVSGNTCKRGEQYGRAEVTHPVRVVTTTVPVIGSARERMVSVKTVPDIAKDKVFDVMRALEGVVVTAPVSIGDVIVHDVCGTGSDIVATKGA